MQLIYSQLAVLSDKYEILLYENNIQLSNFFFVLKSLQVLPFRPLFLGIFSKSTIRPFSSSEIQDIRALDYSYETQYGPSFD